MAVLTLQRVCALVSAFALFMQFPVTTIPVAKDMRGVVGLSEYEVSVLSVAAAGFTTKQKLPVEVLEKALTPGAYARDLWHKVQCKQFSNEASCSRTPILEPGAKLLESTQPMYQPGVILRSLARTFRNNKDLVQAGCSITMGSSILSIIVPAKVGFFGYAAVIYSAIQAGSKLTPYAYFFLGVFLVATDVLAVFKNRSPASARAAATPAIAAADAPAPAAGKPEPKKKR